MVSVRDVIFNEDEIWDREPIQYTADKIKKLNETIEIVQVPESGILETEDIQLGEDLDVELASWTKDRGFSKNQAVVLDLFTQQGISKDYQHVVRLDNLFTSARLLTELSKEGFGAAGTVRT